LIANAGSAADAVLPPRQQAQAILDAYLEAAKFEHVRVNTDYIASLGLTAP
jgi:hypothetical protein